MESQELQHKLQEISQLSARILAEIQKRIVGQQQVGQRLLMAMISGGHVLLEGLPGLAKTTAIKSLSEATSLSFKRIQFTPDLLPADVIGTQVYDPKNATFRVKKGPIFANLILADEINRAPAKVQSALLEAMEERQVTIGDETFHLEEPFLVMATQNPVEQEGTYPLPEAQVDRFLFKLNISYSSHEEEQEIIRRAQHKEQIKLTPAASREDILRMRGCVDQMFVSDKIRKYIVDLVFATREPKARGFADIATYIEYGASPRASLALDRLSKIQALLEGRTFVTPQDVKDVAVDILRHRIKPTYEAEAENISSEQLVKRILERVDVP